MGRKFLIADSWQFNSNPPCWTNVRRPVEFFWISFDQRCLHANRGRYCDCDMTIIVVIDRTHRKDPFFHKESWFAVRKFFPGFGQPQAKTAHAFDVFFRINSGHESRFYMYGGVPLNNRVRRCFDGPTKVGPQIPRRLFVCFVLENIATAKAIHYHRPMKHSPLASAILLLLCFSVHAQSALPDDGQVKNGVYLNSFFSFGFTYPKDWVVHDEAINERIRERAKAEAKSRELSPLKAYLLFTVSRHPRGTPGITLNPTVLVIAENIAPVPRNYSGKDYLMEVRPLKQKEGAQPLLNEPVEFRVNGFQFFRDDYRREVNGVSLRNAIFVTIKKGYALAFSFTGEDQKSVDEMAQAMNTILPVGTGGVLGTGSAPERKPN